MVNRGFPRTYVAQRSQDGGLFSKLSLGFRQFASQFLSCAGLCDLVHLAPSSCSEQSLRYIRAPRRLGLGDLNLEFVSISPEP